MILSFESTVSALTYSIIRERCDGAEHSLAFPHNRVVRFVLDEHARMPDYLRLALVGLTLVFDAAAFPVAGCAFHQLPHTRRWRQILNWQGSVLGFRRDLMRFYQSLVIFGWYAEVHEAARV
jgi:hypothetical protein